MIRCVAFMMLSFMLGCTFLSADEKPSITGIVQDIATGKGDKAVPGRFLIHGQGDYDKASVKVTDKTVIKIGEGKEAKEGKFSDIKKGTKLIVWFTGPVAESYPVQATAGKIVIMPVVEEKK